MTPRENVQAVLNGQPPEELPFVLSIGPGLKEKMVDRYGENYRWDLFREPIAQLSLWVRWPLVEYDVRDGVGWIKENLLPESLDQMADYPWPDASDPVWYEKTRQQIATARSRGQAVFIMFPAMLHTLDTFRGYDRLFLDFYDEPEKVHALCEKCSEVLAECTRQLCSLDIDVLMVGDDISTQSSPMLSPDLLDDFVFRYDRRYVEIAKAAGKKVLFHTDGVIPDFIADRLVEIGFDLTHPMQPDCNDLKRFAQRYRERIIVYGGLHNTGILQHGSDAEIRAHVDELIGWFGHRIMPSCSDIMGETDPAKIARIPEIIRQAWRERR